MRKAYHYMPLSKYLALEETNGILKPENPIVDKKLAAALGLVIPDERYLFCFLNTPVPENWVTSGWLDNLRKGIHRNKYALVSFDVALDDPAYVLNATELHQFMAELGFPAESFTLELQSKIAANIQRMIAVYKRYINSKTPLRDYHNNFTMHELIVAKEIPFSGLTLEQICES